MEFLSNLFRKRIPQSYVFDAQIRTIFYKAGRVTRILVGVAIDSTRNAIASALASPTVFYFGNLVLWHRHSLLPYTVGIVDIVACYAL